MPISRRRLLEAALPLAIAPFAGPVFAQHYPSRPLRLVVPYPPGGTFDAVARLLAEKLTTSLGQAVVVENKPGANGMIAISSVARAEPDGYTLLVTGSSLVLNFTSFRTVSYQLDDFTAISGLVDMPLAIGVNPSQSAKTFQDLVASIKAAPDKYSVSTAGTIEEIVLARLKKSAGLKFQNVPYPGASPSLNAAVSGVVPAIITAAGAAQPMHKAGRLRVLAVTGERRLSAMPEVPTLSELGYTAGELSSWAGVIAPKKTDPIIVNRLSDEVRKAMQSPEAISKLDGLSLPVNARDAAQFGKFIDAELVKWKQAALDAGIRAE